MNNKELTICTVCTNDEYLIKKNINLTKKNNRNFIHKWVIAYNYNKNYTESNIFSNIENVLIIKGNQKDEIGVGALNHGICLNRTKKKIDTRFVLFIDPDFFVLEKNWIKKIINFMILNNIHLFGAPWHPKWYMKYRYFPCSHFLLIDTKNVSIDDIDFRPLNLFWTGSSFDYNFSIKKNSKIKNLLKKITPTIFRKIYRKFIIFKDYNYNIRKKIGWDGDTTSRIYLTYQKKKEVFLLTPIYNVKSQWNLPISLKINKIIEYFLPENLSYIPKKNTYFAHDIKFSKLFENLEYEGFLWNEKPFGFHVRGYPKDKTRIREKEIIDVDRVINNFNENFNFSE